MPNSIKDPTATAVGYDTDDIIDIAEDFGTVVEPDPREGIQGFVSFSFEGFINFAKALIVDVRNDDYSSRLSMDHKLDVVMAHAITTALGHGLYDQYGPYIRNWPKDDKYVLMHSALTKLLEEHRQRQADKSLQEV
jgi:hypothetical protein